MEKLTIIAICIGFLYSALIAHRNTQTWPSKLLLWGSITSSIPIILITITEGAFMRGSGGLGIFIFAGIILLGLLLFLIGLLGYCAKTLNTTKSNKELDYLNFQIRDRMEAENEKG